MSKYINTKLDQAIGLQKMKFAEIKRIQSTTHKSIGRIRIEMSPEEISAKVKRISQEYDNRIRSVYKEINQDQKEHGLPEIKCPV